MWLGPGCGRHVARGGGEAEVPPSTNQEDVQVRRRTRPSQLHLALDRALIVVILAAYQNHHPKGNSPLQPASTTGREEGPGRQPEHVRMYQATYDVHQT